MPVSFGIRWPICRHQSTTSQTHCLFSLLADGLPWFKYTSNTTTLTCVSWLICFADVRISRFWRMLYHRYVQMHRKEAQAVFFFMHGGPPPKTTHPCTIARFLDGRLRCVQGVAVPRALFGLSPPNTQTPQTTNHFGQEPEQGRPWASFLCIPKSDAVILFVLFDLIARLSSFENHIGILVCI